MPTHRYNAILGSYGIGEPVLRASAATLKSEVDLRPWSGPIKDQGNEGSCTGHAWSSAREWINRKYEKGSVVLSPQFLYAEELLKEGMFPQDNGAMPITGSQVLVETGCCSLDDFPYKAGQITSPTDTQIAAAAQWKTGAYKLIPTLGDVLSCLSDPTPWPVTIGFNVYESFESDQVSNTGIMPIPQPGETLLGGHETLIIGYNLSEQWLWVQNSWGDNWGIRGFFKMPFAVAAQSECRMTHTGKPW